MLSCWTYHIPYTQNRTMAWIWKRLFDFNSFDYKQKYYKILQKDMCHHGFHYKLGLNKDHLPFYPHGSCLPGGLYFTDREHILSYVYFGELLAEVTVPCNARVYKDPYGDQYKADQIILSNIVPIYQSDLVQPCWEMKPGSILGMNTKSGANLCVGMSEVETLNMLSRDGLKLRDVINPTETMKYVAVLQNPCAIQFVNHSHDALSLIAVGNNGLVLKHIPKLLQNFEICKEAVQQNGLAFQYVCDHIGKSNVIRTSAVRQNGWALKYMLEPSKLVCDSAVEQNGLAISIVPLSFKTEYMLLKAVKQNWLAIKHMKDPSWIVCTEAIFQHPLAILHCYSKLVPFATMLASYIIILLLFLF